ncbi:MAG: hypothetical protein K0U84_15170 [Actinomycetia bacterium]|nr:hypothetical protein [Actinomycetes bacterium]
MNPRQFAVELEVEAKRIAVWIHEHQEQIDAAVGDSQTVVDFFEVETPEELAKGMTEVVYSAAQRLMSELDSPVDVFRLGYTLGNVVQAELFRLRTEGATTELLKLLVGVKEESSGN